MYRRGYILYDLGTQQVFREVLVDEELIRRKILTKLDTLESDLKTLLRDGNFPIYVRVKYLREPLYWVRRVSLDVWYVNIKNELRTITIPVGSRILCTEFDTEFERFENHTLHLVPTDNLLDLRVVRPDRFIPFARIIKNLVKERSITSLTTWVTVENYVYKGVKEERAGKITPSELLDYYVIKIPIEIEVPTLESGRRIKAGIYRLMQGGVYESREEEILKINFMFELPDDVVTNWTHVGKLRVVAQCLNNEFWRRITEWVHTWMKIDVYIGRGVVNESCKLVELRSRWIPHAYKLIEKVVFLPNLNCAFKRCVGIDYRLSDDVKFNIFVDRVELSRPVEEWSIVALIKFALFVSHHPLRMSDVNLINEMVEKGETSRGDVRQATDFVEGFLSDVVKVRIPFKICLTEAVADPDKSDVLLNETVVAYGENVKIPISGLEIIGNIGNKIVEFFVNMSRSLVEVITNVSKSFSIHLRNVEPMENTTIATTSTKGSVSSSDNVQYVGKFPDKIEIKPRYCVYTNLSKPDEICSDHVVNIYEGDEIQLCLLVEHGVELPSAAMFREPYVKLILEEEGGGKEVVAELYRMDVGKSTLFCTYRKFVTMGKYRLYALGKESVKLQFIKGKC